MRDIEIWERLTPPGGDLDLDPELLPALAELGAAPLQQRAALLGLAAHWCDHADARVRAAAISVLRGVTGIEGLRLLIAALDDDEAEVRMAAVEGLYESARGDQQELRLAHALFHPRVDVRRSVAARLPSSIADLGTYLRSDPACADLVAELPLRGGLRLALDLHARDRISDTLLTHALAACETDELIELLRYGQRRSKAELAEARRWLDGDGPAPGGLDLLDRIVDAIDYAETLHGDASYAIPPLVRAGRHADCGARLVVSIVLRAIRRNSVGDSLWTFAVRSNPTILAAEVTPMALRQHAAKLLARREPRPRSNPELADRLLASALIRRVDGSLDLHVATSVAWLLEPPRVARLLEQLGAESVLAAIAAGDLRGFLALCNFPPEPPRAGRIGVGDLIAAASPETRPRMRAVALASWTTNFPRAEALVASLSELELGECVPPLLDEVDGLLIHLGPKTPPKLAALLVDALTEPARLELARGLLAGRELSPLRIELLERLLREATATRLTLWVAATPVESLLRLLEWLEERVKLPLEVERALAELLRSHPSQVVRDAASKLASPIQVATERPLIAEIHCLTRAEVEAIAGCAFAKLGNALAPALASPSRGLTPALIQRSDHGRTSLEVCVALLGAHDPIADVARCFADYFDHDNPDFARTLLAAAVTMWQRNPNLPPLGNAWLHNFEQHAFGFGEWLLANLGGLIGAFRRCADLAEPILRVRCFEAAAYVCTLWRYRDAERIASMNLDGVPTLLVEQLDTELGPPAAKLLVSLFLCGQCARELEALKPRVLMLAPDLDRVTRHELHRWLRIDGLPDRDVGARARGPAVSGDLLAQLKTSEDLELLAESCLSPNLAIVNEAVLRLLEFGEAGELRLTLVLAGTPPPPRFAVLIESVAMWTSQSCVDDVRALAADPELAPELRYRLAFALVERGEQAQIDVTLAVLREPGPTGWFRIDDWDKLARHTPVRTLAFALVTSPHPHAYQHAVDWLLSRPSEDQSALAPLREFLRTGTQRPSHLRRRAAGRLLAAGDPIAIPVMLPPLVTNEPGNPPLAWVVELAPEPRARVIDAVLAATLIGGREVCVERRLCTLLDVPDLDHGGPIARVAVDRALQRLFIDGSDQAVRTHLARRVSSPSWRQTRLQGIAEIFAWGVRRGRELTGRLFRVHMTDKREDFGYTHLDEDRIFVTPLPYFAGERHGREIVEALILHEIGHHLHHRGEAAAKIWERAQERRLHGVLNLVADEHLERNLRSRRDDYGDRLKRLAAHAFLHAERDLGWTWLLDRLGVSSFAILSSKPTTPAHQAGALRIRRGELMQALEDGGNAWARFARALRMGLGNRWQDPKVEAGLALFRGRFRHADMDELWRITEELARLFASELPFADLCGGHETLGDTEREGAIARRDLSDDEVQEQIERILDPRQLGKHEGRSGRLSGKLAINVGEDERFDVITTIRRVPRKPDEHRKRAREVARHAARLRAYLCELGLNLVPRHARLRGRSFDRTRIQAVVLRRDPRMLIARELEIRSDLFIGVLIDCSGSMSIRDLLAKAQTFAVLIAEAVRALPGVDARFFGFTDSVIWDAGDAERCAVTSLETEGGNNDAAALLHAAQVAAGSRRKAKLLVMISDGLPTECSVAALRNLVVQLGRRHIICAQVAVRPLEEVCFPHYVSLADESIERATVRFGELIAKLARRALGR